MTANKTACAIPPGTAEPDERFGSAVAKGHPGGGPVADGAMDGAQDCEARDRSAMDRAYWFQQVLRLYGDHCYATLRRLEWEWESSQDFLLLDDDSDVLGWISWYRCDFRTLAFIRDRDLAALHLLGSADELLTQGEYLYIPTVVSARPLKAHPGARHVLFVLLSWARARNPDARLIAWHSRGRGGRFQVFPFHHQPRGKHGL